MINEEPEPGICMDTDPEGYTTITENLHPVPDSYSNPTPIQVDTHKQGCTHDPKNARMELKVEYPQQSQLIQGVDMRLPTMANRTFTYICGMCGLTIEGFVTNMSWRQ